MRVMATKDSNKSKSKEDQGRIIIHKHTKDKQNVIFGEDINSPGNASKTKPGSSMRTSKIKSHAGSFATSLPTTIGKANRLDQGISRSNNKADKELDSKSRSLTYLSKEPNITEVQLNGGSTTKISIPGLPSTDTCHEQLTTKTTNCISKSKLRESDDTRTVEKSNNIAPSLAIINSNISGTNHISAISSKSEDGIAKKSLVNSVSSQSESFSEDDFRKMKNSTGQTAEVECRNSGATPKILKEEKASPKQTNTGSNFKEDTSFIEVFASTDSIVDLTVDVILSSEDSSIQSGGIIAKIIAEKGGPLLDVCKDCLRKMHPSILNWAFQPTPATGKLKCKHIFHAVVPQFSRQKQSNWVDGLESLLFDIFSRTEHMGYESIALPVIGTRKGGAPIDFVIDLICASIDKFATTKTSIKGLRTVMIVHPDKRVVDTIEHSVKSSRTCLLTLKPVQSLKATQDNGKSYFLSVVDIQKDTCPVCMEELASSKLKQLSRCKHIFCKICIEKCFIQTPACPVCNMVYGKLTGNQPDGIMIECFQNDIHLKGYKKCGVIKIFYSFLDGKQLQGQPNPGKVYRGTKRTAYLPDNTEGQKVHRLLRRAFQQRILFTIGSSRTTGKEDVVTWNDVHHKTRIDGGPARFGYPDPGYISRVLDELAAKGITEE
ncbi:uncharacterized protein LOC134691199 isoform X2 [Mytilus trossulus]|uniref:uncharacterized protein LOC134691199 isoform X2 n=1 Tax=Mytilus trossulus TaxID=6551 RepID=UPI0030071DD7